MSRFEPNDFYWQFLAADAPETWASKQAKRLYDAAVEAETAGTDIAHAVSGSVRIAPRPSDDLMSPYGSSPESAERRARFKVAQLRRKADRIEKLLESYGGATFVTKPEALRAPNHPFDAQRVLLEVMRTVPDVIWIHGVEFVRDASGAFVRK
jgi:hypothetical protein